MNHPEMIRRFERLLPEIHRTQDPEGVLLKCAKENDFSPALLEKLAHIHNVAKSLSFFDKSANRAGAFTVIDVPALLEKFSAFEPAKAVTKLASADLPAYTGNPYAVPFLVDEIYHDRPESFRTVVVEEEKCASHRIAEVNEMFKSIKQAAANRHIADDAELLLEDLKEALEQKLAAMIEKLTYDGLEDYPLVKAQLLRGVTKSSGVLHILEKRLDERGFHADKQAAELPAKEFARDPGDWFPVTEEAVQILDLYKEAAEAESILKEAVKFQTEDLMPSVEDRRWKPMFPEKGRPLPRGGGKDEDLTKGAPKPGGGGSGIGKDEDLTKGAPVRKGTGGIGKDEDEDLTFGAPSGKPKDLDNPDKPVGSGAALKAVTGNFEKTIDSIPSTIKELIGAGGTVAKMPGKGGDLAARLAQIIHGGKDKGRQSIDQALEEDESAATLVRLMKDDIIGQADPSLVSELYHSLRTANPGAMRDDNLARLMLRESLQYGSVPVHMYSDLTKLRGDQQDVEHDERVNENNRYGIGSRPAARAKRDEKS